MSLANDASAGKPDAARAAEEKADPLLTWLRRVRWVLGWSLFLIWSGVIAGVLFFVLGAFVMVAQLEPLAVVLFCIAGLFVFQIAFCTATTVTFGAIWVTIVFFGYTRYSLRTMLLTVWLFAALIALIATGHVLLLAFAIPMLIAASLVLLIRIATYDPLASPEFRKEFGLQKKDDPSADKTPNDPSLAKL